MFYCIVILLYTQIIFHFRNFTFKTLAQASCQYLPVLRISPVGLVNFETMAIYTSFLFMKTIIGLFHPWRIKKSACNIASPTLSPGILITKKLCCEKDFDGCFEIISVHSDWFYNFLDLRPKGAELEGNSHICTFAHPHINLFCSLNRLHRIRSAALIALELIVINANQLLQWYLLWRKTHSWYLPCMPKSCSHLLIQYQASGQARL